LLTKDSHLDSLFGVDAKRATDTMVELFAAKYGKTIEATLRQFPIKISGVNEQSLNEKTLNCWKLFRALSTRLSDNLKD